jgi:hypothetical protein
MTKDGVWIGNRIYWTFNTQLMTTLYKLLSRTDWVFSVTVFTALLVSGFQRCGVLGFRVQRHLSSLARTFHLQLSNCTNRIKVRVMLRTMVLVSSRIWDSRPGFVTVRQLRFSLAPQFWLSADMSQYFFAPV